MYGYQGRRGPVPPKGLSRFFQRGAVGCSARARARGKGIKMISLQKRLFRAGDAAILGDVF